MSFIPRNVLHIKVTPEKRAVKTKIFYVLVVALLNHEEHINIWTRCTGNFYFKLPVDFIMYKVNHSIAIIWKVSC